MGPFILKTTCEDGLEREVTSFQTPKNDLCLKTVQANPKYLQTRCVAAFGVSFICFEPGVVVDATVISTNLVM